MIEIYAHWTPFDKRYGVRQGRRVLVEITPTPLRSAARVLLDEGEDPEQELIMREEGTNIVTRMNLRDAAYYTGTPIIPTDASGP